MKKILIIDDEHLILRGLGTALRTSAVDVKTADTGKEALLDIADSYYNLCFLDVFLPDINGVEVLKKIKKLSPNTKVIMMSAGIIDSQMEEYIEKYAFTFIVKPFELHQVKQLAQDILAEESIALLCL